MSTYIRLVIGLVPSLTWARRWISVLRSLKRPLLKGLYREWKIQYLAPYRLARRLGIRWKDGEWIRQEPFPKVYSPADVAYDKDTGYKEKRK